MKIIRRSQKNVRFEFYGSEYLLNGHGVLCSVTVLDGKKWYSIMDELIGSDSYRAEVKFCDALKSGVNDLSELRGAVWQSFNN
ncbi:MAG: hypothetical protein NUV65_00805 [Candidatus Roizmanbacteria bacterium]|nr:hypothetical protein [Candidatus Roizmanbacteria bacterium]